MAQSTDTETVTGQKRGPGWPPKNDTPIAKKPKLSTAVQPLPAIDSPVLSTPTTEKRSSKLPWKLADNKHIPALPQPQRAQLPDNEYQSIAASAVLQASLSRSQAKWTHDGLFERYWVKPETGKNARPPPPNNPDLKWMKSEGECRIRMEPHIFECHMYVEERARPPPPPKQYAPPPPAQSAYGQPYRAQQPVGQQYALAQVYHSQTLPPIRQPAQQHPNTLPPINNITQRTPSAAPSPVSRAPATPAPPEKKQNPDPVISRLAGRASSDPELKTLMKEVATGNATPEQLKIFQRHIDELQAQIKREKEEREEEEQRRRHDVDHAAHAHAAEDVIQYDGAGDSRSGTPTPVHYHNPQTATPYQSTAQPYSAPTQQQPSWAPSPTHHAVILSFNTPGASEDRFLFPQHSILERLSANHYLASFLLVRKGREAADPTGLDPDKEYWQPVTLMLEVKVGLEELPGYVKRWVKPAEEVRRYMEEVMGRCARAPEAFLAMRLPGRGAEAESTAVSKEATPMSVVVEERPRVKSSVKYIKKASSGVKGLLMGTPTAGVGKKVAGGDVKAASSAAEVTPVTPGMDVKAVAATDGAGDQPGTNESGRPRRAVRKSVRISEG